MYIYFHLGDKELFLLVRFIIITMINKAVLLLQQIRQ